MRSFTKGFALLGISISLVVITGLLLFMEPSIASSRIELTAIEGSFEVPVSIRNWTPFPMRVHGVKSCCSCEIKSLPMSVGPFSSSVFIAELPCPLKGDENEWSVTMYADHLGWKELKCDIKVVAR